jgi:hypothetical protein
MVVVFGFGFPVSGTEGVGCWEYDILVCAPSVCPTINPRRYAHLPVNTITLPQSCVTHKQAKGPTFVA